MSQLSNTNIKSSTFHTWFCFFEARFKDTRPETSFHLTLVSSIVFFWFGSTFIGVRYLLSPSVYPEGFHKSGNDVSARSNVTRDLMFYAYSRLDVSKFLQKNSMTRTFVCTGQLKWRHTKRALKGGRLNRLTVIPLPLFFRKTWQKFSLCCWKTLFVGFHSSKFFRFSFAFSPPPSPPAHPTHS